MNQLTSMQAGGKMSFEDQQIHNADQTSERGSYRFWLNDDDDSNNEDHPGSSTKDCDDNQIQSYRDLEDFVRLWFYVGGLHAGITDGTFEIGLEWKSVTGNPSIKIYQAAEIDGGDQYLKDDVAAGNQTLRACLKSGG